jgi:DNA-binding MarR family transcriptional regulator
MSAPKPGDFICFAVYSASHAFSRIYRPLLASLGVTYPQYLVLVALWSRDDRTVGDLGGQLFLETSTLTPLLKRLESLEMVTRSRDPADERQVRVRLTRKGAALQAEAAGFPSCVDAATGLPSDKLRRLREAIIELRTAVLETAATQVED